VSSIRLRGAHTDLAAKARGIKTFDTALPQDWVDEVVRRTGFDPFGHFVWSYDAPRTFGMAMPVTDVGVVILAWYDSLEG
jgi:hypothetical protein